MFFVSRDNNNKTFVQHSWIWQ